VPWILLKLWIIEGHFYSDCFLQESFRSVCHRGDIMFRIVLNKKDVSGYRILVYMHRGMGEGWGVRGWGGGHQYSRKQYRPHCDSLGAGGQETLWMEEWVMWDIRPANATRWDMHSLPSLHRHLDPTNAPCRDMHSLPSLHRHLDPTNAPGRDMHSLTSLHRHLDPTNGPSAGVCTLSPPSTDIWIRIMQLPDICTLSASSTMIWIRKIRVTDPDAHGSLSQGADHLPLPLLVAKTGRNHLNEEFISLLPTGIGERF
jgi:hypothetical protein